MEQQHGVSSFSLTLSVRESGSPYNFKFDILIFVFWHNISRMIWRHFTAIFMGFDFEIDLDFALYALGIGIVVHIQ